MSEYEFEWRFTGRAMPARPGLFAVTVHNFTNGPHAVRSVVEAWGDFEAFKVWPDDSAESTGDHQMKALAVSGLTLDEVGIHALALVGVFGPEDDPDEVDRMEHAAVEEAQERAAKATR